MYIFRRHILPAVIPVLSILLALPRAGICKDFETELFAGYRHCTPCHDNILDQDDRDVSFVDRWRQSMMRFGFADPFWRAKVRSETLRIPGLSPYIEKKCVQCHGPMAATQAVSDGETVHIFDGGFMDPANPYHSAAMQGIGCTLCHQITPDSLNSTDPFSGNFLISEEGMIQGPFIPDFQNIMFKAAGYLPVQSSHMRDPAFCALCHDLYTDYVDENGTVVSTPETRFPEQTPYREWLQSSYAENDIQCRDCHLLPPAPTKITSVPRRARERNGVKIHTYYPANTSMLKILEDAAETLGLPSLDLSQAIEEGQEYLSKAGEIEVASWTWNSDNTLRVTIRIRNHAGHKLPTGIPLRRMFIHFQVRNRNGDIVFNSGDTDDQGRIIGVDSDVTPSSFEPHYKIIDSEEKVQVYEGVMGNVEGGVSYTLLRASHFKKDNRILPAGFDKQRDDTTVGPVGTALDDNDFNSGQDLITYEVQGVVGSKCTVEIELKYQTMSFPVVHDLTQDAYQDPDGPIPFFLEEHEKRNTDFEIIDTARLALKRRPQ